jgi:hypothetical protein
MSVQESASRLPTTHMRFEVDGVPQKATAHWYRGEHCNFNPRRENLATAGMIADHVLAGWLPPEPLIGPQTRIAAFGSCFARHICEWLAARRFRVLNAEGGGTAHLVNMAEGMVNTFSILEQIRWALEGDRIEGEYWHGPGAVAHDHAEETRLETRRILLDTDVFIITLGLSEIWCDKLTGGVFWRGVPGHMFDPERHEFRVASFQENKANIRAVHDLIREHRPDAKIIFTVSPIPLVATFRPVSCITANSASKALLRAAVDEVYREVAHLGAMFYWPSYEILLDVFDNRWIGDRRHVKKSVLNFMMALFERWLCHGQETPPRPAEAFAHAVQATLGVGGRLTKRFSDVLEAHDASALAALLHETEAAAQSPFAAACMRELLEEWTRTDGGEPAHAL